MRNMEKESTWGLLIARASLPPKPEPKSEPEAKSEPEEKDSFSLSSLVGNFFWTKDAPAESKPLLSGKKIGPNNSK
jgi:hypothetical protein